MARNKDKIEVKKERRAKLVVDIKSFFLDNREEEIGDLQAELLINFLIEQIGPEIYNQAIDDALYWFKGRLSDLEVDYYMLEKRAERIAPDEPEEID